MSALRRLAERWLVESGPITGNGQCRRRHRVVHRRGLVDGNHGRVAGRQRAVEAARRVRGHGRSRAGHVLTRDRRRRFGRLRDSVGGSLVARRSVDRYQRGTSDVTGEGCGSIVADGDGRGGEHTQQNRRGQRREACRSGDPPAARSNHGLSPRRRSRRPSGPPGWREMRWDPPSRPEGRRSPPPIPRPTPATRRRRRGRPRPGRQRRPRGAPRR